MICLTEVTIVMGGGVQHGCVWEGQLGIPREATGCGGGERPALAASVRWPWWLRCCLFLSSRTPRGGEAPWMRELLCGQVLSSAVG